MTVIELPNDLVNPYKSRLLTTPKKVFKKVFKKTHTKGKFLLRYRSQFSLCAKKTASRCCVCVFGFFFLSLTPSKFPPSPPTPAPPGRFPLMVFLNTQKKPQSGLSYFFRENYFLLKTRCVTSRLVSPKCSATSPNMLSSVPTLKGL